MSRTDRHRPPWVQQADPYEQGFRLFDQGQNYGWVKLHLFLDSRCRQYHCCSSGPRRARVRSLRHQDTMRARQALKGDLEAWDGRLRPRGW